MKREADDADAWRSASWRGAEESVLEAGAAMTLAERLLWLEQTSRLLGALGARGDAPSRPAGELAGASRSEQTP